MLPLSPPVTEASLSSDEEGDDEVLAISLGVSLGLLVSLALAFVGLRVFRRKRGRLAFKAYRDARMKHPPSATTEFQSATTESNLEVSSVQHQVSTSNKAA